MQTKAQERMWLNKKGDALLVDNHKDASQLYAAKGDVVPESACEKFGVSEKGWIEGDAAEKQRDKNEDKSRRGGEDKSRDGGDTKDKEPLNNGDDFTVFKGIGAKTAISLNAGGIATYKALAEVDLEPPPEINGIPANADWQGWVAQAQAHLAATQAAV